MFDLNNFILTNPVGIVVSTSVCLALAVLVFILITFRWKDLEYKLWQRILMSAGTFVIAFILFWLCIAEIKEIKDCNEYKKILSEKYNTDIEIWSWAQIGQNEIPPKPIYLYDEASHEYVQRYVVHDTKTNEIKLFELAPVESGLFKEIQPTLSLSTN